jgi:hypothetical protein
MSVSSSQYTTIANNGDSADEGRPPSAVEVFQGVHFFSNVIDVSGATADVETTIDKKMDAFDWHMIFALYGTPVNARLDDWIERHRHYEDKTLIDRMFPFIGKRQFTLSCKVTIRVSGPERLKLRLGARVLRLRMAEAQKDAPILNAANIVAVTSSGVQYDAITVSCSGQ